MERSVGLLSWRNNIVRLAQKAKEASFDIAKLDTKTKNRLLLEMAKAIKANFKKIARENEKDLKNAEKKGFSSAFVDRLTLTPKRLNEVIASLKAMVKLPDPVGKEVAKWRRPNKMRVKKVRIPLGVIGIIYESRPDVTVDTAALCLKSGNAVVLRGGSEAFHSNKILSSILRNVLKKNRINPDMIQILPTTNHAAVKSLLAQDRYIDLIIPRGGASLMQMVRKLSKIPVIRHDKGVCHVFVDRDADLKMAEKICINAKVQRPGTCNAMETLLIDSKIASKFLPRMIQIFKENGVEVRKKGFGIEYLDKIVSVKVVKDLNEAIAHIKKYGSLHTEAIVTRNKRHADQFLKEVLASCVLVNASTRLNDGFQLGLGAEVGISTTKLHAFGPMGLEELTTTKYIVHGSGQVRQ
ncbi:MAG: glutamate-5-semialdehyde dehydrogenase [Deltaproteobacteria bacterium RIFCSPLOWO2_01_44_7]|nr:MAG: glutamate-5-semialdehyde dehydrogenase [Deltaproteobacteria bacterium RIFCSPHIGHO2_01_FULL_43_49]OGQ15190.1 MAG: glutamate-5-semialdehyde dehydrogenase [Deltaproteobacteria bacterium RIFCSPHIGHO2_02_FULL_44_53]OGQ27189.1 MAG: glutamate-5-semialdehyde dehydrogenase [Deltaproteobacteria bacterium RIFCSPHIGHO2_12_FULL_44_21]OGQ31707.1 MAG: glutamate-5-semialdehyde dehydrogenase [Deltaproteobacteria bacterium RIFCSPLOWO2_01_FULL_45_74]OGQ38094.1 MAG: glutamate-5-semialdehyde dehydrogenase [